MDKALVTEFTTLLQRIVQLLATDYEKKIAICCEKKVNVDNTTQSFVFSLTLNDMVLYVVPSLPPKTNHNYTHAFEIATTAVDLQRPQLIELSSSQYCC